jgi:hypothetical protein
VRKSADLFDDQVDGFGATVGDSVGVEVGQHLGLPGLQRSAEPGDLGDRTGGEAGDHLLRDLAAAICGRVVDRAELLVALPSQVDLPAGVDFLQAAGELGLLLLGEVLYAVAKQAADLVERVVLVAAMTKRVLLDAATYLVEDLGAEANDMEGVEYRDRVAELVADRVVESDRSALPVLPLVGFCGPPAG